MLEILLVLVGILAGIAIGTISFVRKTNVGTLKLRSDDPDELPYLFVELSSDGLSRISKYKVVTMNVDVKNYISHT